MRMLRVNSYILGVLPLMFLMVNPASVSAQQPQLVSEFSGRNVTTNSSWENPVDAKVQDVVRYKLVITNSNSGTTAKSVNVRVMLPILGGKQVLSPSSYVTALNTTARDTYAMTEVGETDFGLLYISGTSRLTKNGNTTSLSPDDDFSNVTVSAINIGDIAGGVGNGATIEFEARVVERSEMKKYTTTITPTVAQAIGGAAISTSSAVAATTPTTGITDPVFVNTFGWMAVGGAGIALRKFSSRIAKKAQTGIAS
jgi:hypothetical protein